MDNFKKIMIESDHYNIATTVFGLLSDNVAFSAAMYLARKVDTVYTNNEQIKSDILDIEFDLMNDQDITEEELQEKIMALMDFKKSAHFLHDNNSGVRDHLASIGG